MGLFGKKEPCPICGGKLPMLLATKLEGQAICNDCAAKIDLPQERESALTMQGFREYLAFYEQNCKLREQFVVSEKIDFGVMDTKIIFDHEHNWFCMSKSPDKTVFEGVQLKSFTIWEDNRLLCEGSPQALRWHESTVPDWATAIAPQVAQFHMNRAMLEAIDRMDDDDTHNHNRYVNIPEPMDQFNVELCLDHPYWSVIHCDMSGPTLSSSHPDVADYMNDYSRDRQTVGDLVYALAGIAFPTAVECNAGDAAPAAAPIAPAQAAAQPAPAAQDPIEQLKRYKQLMEDGVIDADEFAAKKKQLLGI